MSDKMIRKTFNVTRKTIDADAGIFEAMISTEEVDRDGDVIRAAGMNLENYLRNPIVLFGHDYRSVDAVIGKAIDVTVIPGSGIKATFQFADAATNPKADVVRRLWSGEFLNATSIGFIPREAKPLGAGKGFDFVRSELLEFSVVSVPSNQSALAIRTLQSAELTDGTLPDVVTVRALELLQKYLDIDASQIIEKRGRVLSSKNEEQLRAAQSDMDSAKSKIDDVLAQLDSAQDDDKGLELLAPDAGGNQTLATPNTTDTPALSDERELAELLDGMFQNLKEGLL